MYRFDETNWPIVRIAATCDTSVFDEEEEYTANWEAWLSREGPLGVLLAYEDEEHGQVEKDACRLSNRWHEENRERTGRLCAGIIGFVRSSKLLALYKPIASRAMQKVMDCPGKVCDSEEEARSWLSARLSEVAANEARRPSSPGPPPARA